MQHSTVTVFEHVHWHQMHLLHFFEDFGYHTFYILHVFCIPLTSWIFAQACMPKIMVFHNGNPDSLFKICILGNKPKLTGGVPASAYELEAAGCWWGAPGCWAEWAVPVWFPAAEDDICGFQVLKLIGVEFSWCRAGLGVLVWFPGVEGEVCGFQVLILIGREFSWCRAGLGSPVFFPYAGLDAVLNSCSCRAPSESSHEAAG